MLEQYIFPEDAESVSPRDIDKNITLTPKKWDHSEKRAKK